MHPLQPLSSQFYLNLVGYKAFVKYKSHLWFLSFYLNLVGYKAVCYGANGRRNAVFYLNLVGYKVSLAVQTEEVVSRFI